MANHRPLPLRPHTHKHNPPTQKITLVYLKYEKIKTNLVSVGTRGKEVGCARGVAEAHGLTQ